MIVNENKLNKLIYSATINCDFCPLDNEANLCEKMRGKDCSKSCEEAIYTWLQEMDIVNNRVISPPKEIPEKPDYGVPCEKEGGQCNISCPFHWTDWCPYSE